VKLFAIYVGGEHPRAHIEIHDMRFVVADTITDTHAALREQWWGTPGTLHIDCWAVIDHADGYNVTLRPEGWMGAERLYYVNLGGYDPTDFAEQHRNMFVVATSLSRAKAKAIEAVAGWKDPHRDDMYEAEQAFALDTMVGEQLHIHLTPSLPARPLKFRCSYKPLK